jgi:hypothetical protein
VSVYRYTTQPITLVTQNWGEYVGLVVREMLSLVTVYWSGRLLLKVTVASTNTSR